MPSNRATARPTRFPTAASLPLLVGLAGGLVSLALWRIGVAWQRAELPGPLAARLPEAGLAAGLLITAGAVLAVGLAQAERRRTEQALRDSETRYRTLVESAHGLICTHDLEGRVLTVNPAAAAALGYEVGQMVGRTIRDAIAPGRRADFDDYLRRMRTQDSDSGLMKVVTAAGEERVWLYYNRRIDPPGGEPPFVLGHAQDVTDLKRVERTLRREEDLMRGLYGLALDQETGLPDRLQTLLSLGCRHFGLEVGLVLRFTGKEAEILASQAALRELARGRTVSLEGVPGCEALAQGEMVVRERLDAGAREGEGPLHFAACLAAPVRAGAAVWGCLCFASRTPRREPHAASARELLQVMALWVGGEVEKQLRARETALLDEMDSLLQTCVTPEETFGVIRRFGQQLFGGESGVLLLARESREHLEPVADWGPEGRLPGDAVFRPGDCWALRRGRSHLVADTRSGLLCHHLAPPLPGSSLCVPMLAVGEALGVLHLRTPAPSPDAAAGVGRPLTAGQHQLALAFADHLAIALGNLKLRETLRTASIRDPLTGLFNRRYLEESLERELRRARRRRAPLGLAMMDLDHFKLFNDSFGHDAGDALLRALAELLQDQIRGEDIACRYGGEEFLLILPEAPLEVVRERAERVREALRRLRVVHDGNPLTPATLSAGVAAYPLHGDTAAALVRAADAAMYQAKAHGRDRVEVAELLPC